MRGFGGGGVAGGGPGWFGSGSLRGFGSVRGLGGEVGGTPGAQSRRGRTFPRNPRAARTAPSSKPAISVSAPYCIAPAGMNSSRPAMPAGTVAAAPTRAPSRSATPPRRATARVGPPRSPSRPSSGRSCTRSSPPPRAPARRSPCGRAWTPRTRCPHLHSRNNSRQLDILLGNQNGSASNLSPGPSGPHRRVHLSGE